MAVPFAGPRTSLRGCPDRGRVREGAEPLPLGAGFQRRRKCETSPHPTPKHRQASSGLLPRRRLLRVQALNPAPRWRPELRGRRPGKTETWLSRRLRRITMTRPGSQGSGAQFPGPAGLGTFYRTGCRAIGSPFPRPLPVLSLGSLAALPGSFNAPAPALSRANPEPVWRGLHLAFSIIALTFCPAG